MDLHVLRKRYLEFFETRGHVIVPSSSLVPENDPTTLFTGSGMQPLVPYLLGQPHPSGKRLVNSQKSFRAQDIEEVGDNRHTTFFEMLGNWSLGDYFKKEQLSWFFEFLTNEVGLDPSRLYASVFSGDEANGIPADEESVAIWKELFGLKGIEAKKVVLETSEQGGELGMQGGRIFAYDSKKNWWSRSGVPEAMPAGEPGGPDSEVFYEFSQIEHDSAFGKLCHPNCDCGRFMEIGNSVFMEYRKKAKGGFERMAQRNVDFGGGLERITSAVNDTADVFSIDVFQAILGEMKERYGWDYSSGSQEEKRTMRVVADHVRASVFMISDGVLPSNTDQGYILRRLLRRAILHSYKFAPGFSGLHQLTGVVVGSYEEAYPELAERAEEIRHTFEEEEVRFMRTLENGLKKMQRLAEQGSLKVFEDEREAGKAGSLLFELYATDGFPLELSLEEIDRLRGKRLPESQRKSVSEAFFEEMETHKKLSRTAAAGKFKGGLADSSQETTRLHTATHLLLAALREVLGEHVHQRGSNITSERLRLDFSHPEKLTPEQLEEVESLVNEKIAEGLRVLRKEMPREEAVKIGAEMEFGVKYGDVVSVYFFEDRMGSAFSKEFCGGPHVENVREVGSFSIIKQESVGAGVRRIKARVE